MNNYKSFKELKEELGNEFEEYMYKVNLELLKIKDKTTDYYLKTLAKNKSMPDEAVEMFNLLEGNK
ncbi:MAG: hypothetical protein IJ105_01365 [Bacilli bacterium]|nr:hypothetical protein [Bacilli bacterium]